MKESNLTIPLPSEICISNSILITIVIKWTRNLNTIKEEIFLLPSYSWMLNLSNKKKIKIEQFNVEWGEKHISVEIEM